MPMVFIEAPVMCVTTASGRHRHGAQTNIAGELEWDRGGKSPSKPFLFQGGFK